MNLLCTVDWPGQCDDVKQIINQVGHDACPPTPNTPSGVAMMQYLSQLYIYV
jgi:hypothetical protein